MRVKDGDTYCQYRSHLRLDPILMKVITVIDPDCCGHEICKVRWYILEKNRLYTSVFPMATIKKGVFADFIPMPREQHFECVNILKTVESYKNARRRVISRINKRK